MTANAAQFCFDFARPGWPVETNARVVHTQAARNSDPVTSHLAADHITRNGKRSHQQAQAIAAVRAFPGCTSFELGMHAYLDRYMLARRLPECVTGGSVRKGEIRTCSITGRQALTWWPVLSSATE